MSQQWMKALHCQTQSLIEQLQARYQPIFGDCTCVIVDGVAQLATPMRTFNVQTGEFETDTAWLDPKTLMPLDGTITVTDECDCPCEECR